VTGNSIQVTPSLTSTYTLTATNAQGSVTAQTTVTVGASGGGTVLSRHLRLPARPHSR
jgi:hypothetical protein